MIQVGRVGTEACRVLVGDQRGKVMETGMQSLHRMLDGKRALKENFLLSGFNVKSFVGRVIYI